MWTNRLVAVAGSPFRNCRFDAVLFEESQLMRHHDRRTVGESDDAKSNFGSFRPSAAYAPPTQPLGIPARSSPSEVPESFRKIATVKLFCFWLVFLFGHDCYPSKVN